MHQLLGEEALVDRADSTIQRTEDSRPAAWSGLQVSGEERARPARSTWPGASQPPAGSWSFPTATSRSPQTRTISPTWLLRSGRRGLRRGREAACE